MEGGIRSSFFETNSHPVLKPQRPSYCITDDSSRDRHPQLKILRSWSAKKAFDDLCLDYKTTVIRIPDTI